MHPQALDLLFGQRYFDWSATQPIKVLRWRAERYSDEDMGIGFAAQLIGRMGGSVRFGDAS